MKHIEPIKIVVICTLILTILSACGTLEATDDSRHVTELAAKIADFDLPADYSPQFSAEMLGYTLAAYKGPGDPAHLYLIQSDNEADGEELEKALKDLAPGSSDSNTRMTVIENRPVTVRGQEATLVISEGLNHENVTYRQATVAFQGKGGPAMLFFSDTLENWDLGAIETFLGSIQ